MPVKELETLGWLALCLFLSMALMSIKLWQIARLAGAMVTTLVVQIIVLILFVYFVVFWVAGRDYEAAAICSGVSIEWVSKLMGHKNTVTTENYYRLMSNSLAVDAASQVFARRAMLGIDGASPGIGNNIAPTWSVY